MGWIEISGKSPLDVGHTESNRFPHLVLLLVSGDTAQLSGLWTREGDKRRLGAYIVDTRSKLAPACEHSGCLGNVRSQTGQSRGTLVAVADDSRL